MAKSFMHIKKGINLKPLSSPPADPVNGDFYYDPTNGMQVYHNGTWQDLGGGSGGGLEIENINSNTNASVGRHYKTDSSGGAFSITLPDPSGFTSQELLFARIMIQDDALACGSLGQEVTIIPHSGGTIRNSQGTLAVNETVVMDVQGIWLEYTWNPVDSIWMQRDIFIAAANGQTEVQIPKVTAWQSYAPIYTNFDVASSNLKWRQNGENLEITGYFTTASSLISGIPTVGLPNSYTADVPGTGYVLLGMAENGPSNLGANDTSVIIQNGQTALRFGRSNVSEDSLTPVTNDNSIMGSTDSLSFTVSLPVAEFAGANAYETVVLQVPTPATSIIQIPKVTEPTVSPISFASGTKGTTTQDKLVWRQVGAYLEGEIYYQHTASGSAGVGDLQITLPNGYQIDTGKVAIFDESPSRAQDSKFVIGTGIYSPTSGNTSESGLHVLAYSATTIGFTQQIWSLDDISVINANVLGNANVTVSATFRVPIADFAGANAYNEVTVPIEGGGGGGAGGLVLEVQSSNFTAEPSKHYLVDTSGGPITATLPAMAATDIIRFSDANNSWGTNPLTISPNGAETIDGLAEDLVCDVEGTWVQLNADSADSNWVQDDVFVGVTNGQAEVQIPIIGEAERQDLVIGDFGNTSTLTLAAGSEHHLTKRRIGSHLFISGGFHFSGSGSDVGNVILNMTYGGQPIVPVSGRFAIADSTATTTGPEYYRDPIALVGDGVNSFVSFVRQVDTTNGLTANEMGGNVGKWDYFQVHGMIPIVGWEETETITLEVPTPATTTIQIPKVTEFQTWTPTYGGTPGSTTFELHQWAQNGSRILLRGQFTTPPAALGTNTFYVELPNGYQINTDKYNQYDVVGSLYEEAGTLEFFHVVVDTSNPTRLYLQRNTTATVPATWGFFNFSKSYHFKAEVDLLDFAGALAYETVTVPIEGGSSGSGSGGTNFILNGDAETNLVGTSNVTRQTTSPLKGAAHFEVASGQTGIWSTQNFSNYIVDNSIALGVSGIVELAVGGTGRVYIHDGSVEVPGTSYDLVPGLNTLGFNFVPTAASGYSLRIESTSGLIKADELVITDAPLAVGSAGGWKQYSEANGDFTVTGTGWTTDFAIAVPYKDPVTGAWRLRFNIRGSVSSSTRTAYTATISGVTFDGNQSIAGYGNLLATSAIQANDGAGTVTCYHASGATTSYAYSGDVLLASKPTWADFDGTVNILDRGIVQSNAKGRWYRSAALSYTSGNNFAFDTEDTTTYDAAIGVTNSSGVFTVSAAGTYDITAVVGANPAWAANTQLELHVDRGSGLTQERLMSRMQGGGFLADGNASVKLAAGDSFSIRLNDTKAIIVGSAASYIEIERRADNSIPALAGTATSDAADSSPKYLLPLIQESGEGDLGTITNWASPGSKKYRWVREGNKVTFWFKVADTGGSAASSATDFYFTLPGDIPSPGDLFSTDAADEYLMGGQGMIRTGTYLGTAIYTVTPGNYRVYGYVESASAITEWVGCFTWMVD